MVNGNSQRLVGLLLTTVGFNAFGAPFDAAPFGLPLPPCCLSNGSAMVCRGVQFSAVPANAQNMRLEYWGSRWPQQHLPKDREPGGADVGWMELGNWYNGGWRVADTAVKAEAANLVFTFQPLNAREFPNLKDYAADFRYTLKIRIASDQPLPKIERIEAFTDSAATRSFARLEWKKAQTSPIQAEAFNGKVEKIERISPLSFQIQLQAVTNSGHSPERQGCFHFQGGRSRAGTAVPARLRRGRTASQRSPHLCRSGGRAEISRREDAL